jgi:hypothetical protein
MSPNRNHSLKNLLVQQIALIFFLIGISGITCFGMGNEAIKFNTEYKLKRVTPNTVSVYQTNQEGQKQEFLFKDFNADLLLLVYRRIEMEQIALSLTKKYHMDKAECRRQLKISLNTLEEWDIVQKENKY